MKKIIFIILASSIGMISCKQENKSTSSNPASTEVSKTEIKEGNFSAENIISDKDGKAIGAFSVNPPKIQFGSNTYTAKEKEDKRKYYTNGTLTYEVKIKDDSYKLRDASSKLLWKVKTYPDKLKISDNEENLNPFEIKNNNGVIEVSKDGKVVNSVKIEDKNISVNGQPAYSISPASNSFAIGILSIDQIPMEQRIFLLTEFLYQKK